MSAAMFTIAATVATGFFRCGRHFPASGITVQVSDFTDKQWEILKAETKLRIAPASDDDQAKADQRAEQISEAIRSLKAEDYQKDGKPKVDAINLLMGDDAAKVTPTERNGIWEALLADAFKAPEAAT